MSEEKAELSMIACQLRQLLADMGAMRDDMAVMMAVLQRLSGNVSRLVTEVHAMHEQHSGPTTRVSALETHIQT